MGRREFVSEHYWKLFRLMIIGLVVAIFLGELMKRDGGWFLNNCLGMEGFKMHFMSRPEYWFPQVFMVTNLLPYPDVNIWPGPYWFLGIMVQLYIVYNGTIRNGAEGQCIAGLNVGIGATHNGVAHLQANGSNDVSLLAVFVLYQRNVSATVGIVL